MKKASLFLLLLVFAATGFSQTADEVINKFVAASGGKEKLNAINTLQYSQTISMKTPMGDFSVPLKFYRERNKLFRLQASMQFGPQSLEFFTLVTDTAGYMMLPAMPMLGSEGGLKKMEEKDRALQTFQFDAAGLFAGLVDYSAKGNKAEFVKEEKVVNEDCYVIKLTSKTGDETTYFISKSTSLVVRTDVKGGMAANMTGLGGMMGDMGSKAENTEVIILYSDYRDVKGVKFPSKAVIKNQMGDAESQFTDIKINEPIEAKWYRAA